MYAAEMRELAKRGRAAQPEWDSLGFDGRARNLRRAQRLVLDEAERITETICTETGKTYEDAQLAELSYVAAAFGFWASRRRATSRTAGCAQAQCSSKARSSRCATRRSGSWA